MDQGVIAMKRYSIFLESPRLKPNNPMQFSVILWTLIMVARESSYPSAEMQSAYFTAPADGTYFVYV